MRSLLVAGEASTPRLCPALAGVMVEAALAREAKDLLRSGSSREAKLIRHIRVSHGDRVNHAHPPFRRPNRAVRVLTVGKTLLGRVTSDVREDEASRVTEELVENPREVGLRDVLKDIG